MKRIGIVGIMLCLVVAGVSATSTEEGLSVDVDCKNGWWDTDICRDNELQDEFDIVTDHINTNDEKWSKDTVGGGIGVDSVWRAVVGNKELRTKYDSVIDYFKTIFATKQEVEQLNDRLDLIECRIINGYSVDEYDLRFCKALMKSKRLNEPVQIEDWKCDSDLGECIQIIRLVEQLD